MFLKKKQIREYIIKKEMKKKRNIIKRIKKRIVNKTWIDLKVKKKNLMLDKKI